MAGLQGTFSVSFDSKRRLAVPAKLRYALPDGLRDKLYLTRGIEKCITGYSWDEWQKFQTILNKLKINETTKRKIKRQFIGRASELDLDKQGRLIIPDDLVNYAELQSCEEVLVVGCSTALEIWNPRLFEEDGASTEDDIQKTFSEIPLDVDDLLTLQPN